MSSWLAQRQLYLAQTSGALVWPSISAWTSAICVADATSLLLHFKCATIRSNNSRVKWWHSWVQLTCVLHDGCRPACRNCGGTRNTHNRSVYVYERVREIGWLLIETRLYVSGTSACVSKTQMPVSAVYMLLCVCVWYLHSPLFFNAVALKSVVALKSEHEVMFCQIVVINGQGLVSSSIRLALGLAICIRFLYRGRIRQLCRTYW